MEKVQKKSQNARLREYAEKFKVCKKNVEKNVQKAHFGKIWGGMCKTAQKCETHPLQLN